MLTEYHPQLCEGLASWGISLDQDKIDRLLAYGEALLEENQRQNLTRITEPFAVINRHLVDSLVILPWIKQCCGRLCDIGTGGGVPGIPLAIALPELTVFLIDSERKKVAFLQRVSQELGLLNVSASHTRAEEAGHDDELRHSFDLVVSRSVANLAVLCEYTLPLVRTGGVFWAYKGESGRDELRQAARALQILGGSVESVNDYSLPTGEKHTAIKVSKVKNTPPQYPRRPGIPAKRPL